MKIRTYILTAAIVSSLLLLSSCSKDVKIRGKFSVEPQKPKPGDEITVIYNPDSTGLKSSSHISLLAYLYGSNLDETKQVEMQKTSEGWTANFSTADSTKGVLIKFKDEEDIDNNLKQGYLVNLFDAAGEVLPGSYAGYASSIYTWGSYYLDMDRNFDSSLYYFKKDFDRNPGIKNDFLDPYLGVETKLNKDNATSIIIRELAGLYSHADNEKEYTVLADWYNKAEMPNRADTYKKILEEKYPGSDFVQKEKYEAYYNEPNLKKKSQLLEEFETTYPKSKYLTNFYDVMAINYFQNNKFNQLKEYFENNKDKLSTYRFYSISTKMLENNKYPQIALEIAELGVDRARNEVKNPTDEKPEYQSGEEWKEDRESMLGMNLYAYADALFKLGKIKEAEAPLKEAKELTKGKDEDTNQLYTRVLIANGQTEDAMNEIEGYIKQGKATPEMKNMLKEIYAKKNGSTAGFDSYIAQFESVAKQLLVAKLEKQIMTQPAPDFTLRDLNGRKVSLNSLKGKTVIIDFWATWCGPCKASFPGMQKAVELYKDNNNVQFLFVNSWENSEDKEANAQDFITNNNYPFHVLLDESDKVIEDYRVSGIPTKFVIDKNSNIRFKNVGFSGNTDELVDEISTMISMVN